MIQVDNNEASEGITKNIQNERVHQQPKQEPQSNPIVAHKQQDQADIKPQQQVAQLQSKKVQENKVEQNVARQEQKQIKEIQNIPQKKEENSLVENHKVKVQDQMQIQQHPKQSMKVQNEEPQKATEVLQQSNLTKQNQIEETQKPTVIEKEEAQNKKEQDVQKEEPTESKEGQKVAIQQDKKHIEVEPETQQHKEQSEQERNKVNRQSPKQVKQQKMQQPQKDDLVQEAKQQKQQQQARQKQQNKQHVQKEIVQDKAQINQQEQHTNQQEEKQQLVKQPKSQNQQMTNNAIFSPKPEQTNKVEKTQQRKKNQQIQQNQKTQSKVKDEKHQTNPISNPQEQKQQMIENTEINESSKVKDNKQEIQESNLTKQKQQNQQDLKVQQQKKSNQRQEKQLVVQQEGPQKDQNKISLEQTKKQEIISHPEQQITLNKEQQVLPKQQVKQDSLKQEIKQNKNALEVQKGHKIRLNSQNVQTISQGNNQKPIVQFVQYVPTEPAEEQPQDKNQKQPQGQLVLPQNKNPPQEKQESNTKEHIVQNLQVQTPKKAQSQEPKKQQSRKAQKLVYDKKVHDIVQDLQKNDEKKGPLHVLSTVKKTSGRKADLSKLDPHIDLDSKVLSLNIGQLKTPDSEITQAEKELGHLKQKLDELQRKKQQRQAQDIEAPVGTIVNFRNKKNFTGRIIKKSGQGDSRIMESSRVENSLAASRSKVTSSRGFQTGKNFTVEVENDATSKGINFRVRRPSRSHAGQSQASYMQSKEEEAVEKADECFQTTRRQEEEIQQVLLHRPQERQLQFDPNFRQQIQKYFIDLKSEAPTKQYTHNELAYFAKKTFKKFGINLQGQQSATLGVKKYRNCVSFILDNKNTIIWYYEGRFYYGGWKINQNGQGEKIGWGYQYLPGKYAYSGSFQQNKRHGWGVIKFLSRDNDIVYQGNWANGYKQGHGRQIQVDNSQYIGGWYHGKKNGYGTLKITQHEHYAGQFSQGIKNGEGTQVFRNGDMYVGLYKNGKFHGKGIYTWANHSRYQGQFFQGARQGYGLWVANHLDPHSDRYEGNYKHDKKNGFGKYQWKDKTTYQGYFMNDLKHGQGIVSYGDGRTAKLQWFEGTVVPRPKDKSQLNSTAKRPISRTVSEKAPSNSKASGSKHNTESKSRGIRPSQGVQKI